MKMKAQQGILFFGILLASLGHAQNVSDLFNELNSNVVTIQTTEFSIRGGELRSNGAIGSGVIIDESGLIMTAAHVVESANVINVKLSDGRIYSAEILKSVPSVDVALVKIVNPPSNLSVARVGDSDSVLIGHQILIIGAPFGLEHSLSVGHVSGKMKRNMVANGEIAGLIQTDAAINHGNSGGPMYNSQGEVIGIVSFILSEGGGFDGIGFAVDINSAKKVLFENSSFWTGFDGLFLNEIIAGILNVPQKSAVLVQRVSSNSFAHSIGLQEGYFQTEILGQKIWLGGDIILSIQGISCNSPHDLGDIKSQIESLPSDSSVLITVLRKGKTIELRGVISE